MNVDRPSARWLAGGCAAALLTAAALWALGMPESPAGDFAATRLAGPVRILDALFAGCLLALVATLGTLAVAARRGRAAAATLRTIFESSPDGIVMVDDKGVITSANRRAEEMFGHAAGGLTGQSLDALLPRSATRRSGLTPIQPPTGARWSGERVGRRKDGTELTVELSTAPGPATAGPMPVVLRDVTLRKQAEDALCARDAHLQLVVEQMPAILWTTDTQLQITSTLGAGLAALNMQPREVIGMTMLECLGRDNPECTPIAAHLNALRGESLSYEMEWKGRNFQVRVDPLRNRNKGVTGTIGLVLDVTEARQARDELKARARQQAAVARLGQRALGGVDVATLLDEAAALTAQTLDVDFCDVLELCPGESLRLRAGFGWQTRGWEQATADPMTSQAGYTLRTGAPVTVEDLRWEERFEGSALCRENEVISGASVLVHGKGRPFGVLGAYAARQRRFTEDDLHFLQAVANVLATTLERKRAEEAQHRLVAILEATTDCVAIAGVDRRLLYLNRAGRELLGVAPHEDLGSAGREAAQLFREDGLDAATRQGAWSGETALRGRSGKEVPVSQVVLAHRAPGGAVEFLSTIARDVSDRHRLEEQLRQAQKMEAIGRLAGGIAHDFNNLVCIITGYSEFLLRDLPADGKQHGFAQEVHKAGERAASLTRQLLAFSRKQMLTTAVLNLNALVSGMGKMLRRLIGEDVELATTLEPALRPIKADAGQIEQILLNLVVNARDAMPEGGTVTITTSNADLAADDTRDYPEVQPGPYVCLQVSDTGCGMDEHVREHIFEPFFTTKEPGKGTGLGLATVYGIVKQSGGHLEVDSAPGLGATFRIYLPQVQEAGRTAEAPRAPAEAPRGSETVLLVEDEDGVRSLARHVLEANGYTVLEARDGDEALTTSDQHTGPIHLLVSDVVMPKMGGGELSRQLNTLRPAMKVLFMSGFTDSALMRHGIMEGAVDCLLKPFAPQTLAQKVREVLDSSAAPKPQVDHRLSPRRKPQRTARIECRAGRFGLGPNLAEELADLSQDGAAIVARKEVKEGQELEVVLAGQGGRANVKVTAKVVWVVPADNGRYRAGLHFERRLSYAEFQLLAK